MSLIGKAWSYYRENGLVELTHRIHRRRRFSVYVKDVTRSVAPPADDQDITFRVAAAGQEGLVAQGLTHWGDRGEQAIGNLMRQGDLAVVGVTTAQPPKVAFVSWLSRRDGLLLTLHGQDPPPGEVCSRRIWVPEPFRRHGYARRGLVFLDRAALQAGYQRIWAFVIRGNVASCRLHERMGYDEYGVLRLGRRFGRRFAERRLVGQRRWQPLKPWDPDASASDAEA